MTQEQAISVAMNARGSFQVPLSFALQHAEKRIIQLVDNGQPGQPVVDQLPGPGPTRDVIAWVVTVGHDGSSAEFAIDDASTRVIRFRRSR